MKVNDIITERFAEPDYEISDLARKASRMAQKIGKVINSAPSMDDRDYNQLAELGDVLSKVGSRNGPQSMKDVFAHMKQYTDERNAEQKPKDQYPEMTVDRFKALLQMAA